MAKWSETKATSKKIDKNEKEEEDKATTTKMKDNRKEARAQL